MPSLLVTVFIIQLVVGLVNTLGATWVNNLLWNLYNSLPTRTAKDAAEQSKLKSQILKLRSELNATSSQDEFAKWAKLRRQHDKVVEQFEKQKSSLESTKTNFDRMVTTIRWLSTNGLRMFLQFWYAKDPMFWISRGWVPYYAEWLLSFPRAPVGSVSIAVWTSACAVVILLAIDAISAFIALASGTGAVGEGQKRKEEPLMAGGEKSAGQQPGGAKIKKEL